MITKLLKLKQISLTVALTTVFTVATSSVLYLNAATLDLSESPEDQGLNFHVVEKESKLEPLNYVNQPPMVPHSVENFQVNKNVNQCLNCHSAKNSRVTGATRISPTHFMDRDGKISSQTSPRRYFCLQCHVPQTDAKPIIENEFKPLDGYGK